MFRDVDWIRLNHSRKGISTSCTALHRPIFVVAKLTELTIGLVSVICLQSMIYHKISVYTLLYLNAS